MLGGGFRAIAGGEQHCALRGDRGQPDRFVKLGEDNWTLLDVGDEAVKGVTFSYTSVVVTTNNVTTRAYW